MPSATPNSTPNNRPSARERKPTSSDARSKPVTPGRVIDLRAANQDLKQMSAEERVAWSLEQFPKQIVLSSSFGAQSAVSLHMVTRQAPKIPVVLVDTGYLFPETYQFIDEMTERLDLNLKVYRSEMSPAWQEARFGKLWEQGIEGLEKYNFMNKVEPMDRALKKHRAKAWISGVRQSQSDERSRMDVLGVKNGTVKVHPIIDWTDKDIYNYLKQFELPYHPLWEQGYISIGDWHTTHKLSDVSGPEAVRFLGLKRECGLHDETKSVEESGDYVI